MYPSSVFKVLWQFKWVTLTVVLLTALAASYVLLFAGHTYRATMTYAIITPKTLTAAELQEKPELSKLNSDNPYLRSPDSMLLSQVLITKLSAPEIRDDLTKNGLSADYVISQPIRDPSQASWGPGMLWQLTATAATPEVASRSAEVLGDRLMVTLRDMQKINGADDLYLASALSIGGPPVAQEDATDQLRSVIALILGGGVILFGAVSVARRIYLDKERRLARQTVRSHEDRHQSSGDPAMALRVERR